MIYLVYRRADSCGINFALLVLHIKIQWQNNMEINRDEADFCGCPAASKAMMIYVSVSQPFRLKTSLGNCQLLVFTFFLDCRKK